MLLQLHIKNFTIIDNLDIELDQGMTVLTGETGAGKSIIIDTLELALGARGDSTVIRNGCDRCEISAVFDLKNIAPAKDWLISHDIPNDECIVRRIISSDGRSRSSINGVPFLQQTVREFGALLVNIHGQHEHQELLRRDKQRELLDNYANHNDLLLAVKNIFSDWQTANAKLDNLRQAAGNQAQTDLLTYQLQELKELSLAENELEELHQEHKQLANSEELMRGCSNALDLLDANNLNNAARIITGLQNYDNKLSEISEMLQQALILAEEVSASLCSYLESMELSPEKLQKTEQRLQSIHDLARKHRVKPEELLIFQAKLEEQVLQSGNATEKIANLERKCSDLAAKYLENANKLTSSRKQAAAKLEKTVTEELQKLNMQQAKFSVQLLPNKDSTHLSPNGIEQVEFWIVTNPNQPSQLLSKIASGGELSRVSLAIQLQTAQRDNTPTLIFDEVDSGIGGKTAQVVGEMLKELGKQAQVICVTHLPQVAAQGNHHLTVSKQISNSNVTAQITTLTGEARVLEIARMLGGTKISEQTLAHAREMCYAD